MMQGASRWTWQRAMTEVELWHDRLAAERNISSIAPGISADTCIDLSDWPAHHQIGDVEIFKLSTPRMLLEEGARMRHCVGSYVRDVMSGRTSIFSLRRDMRRIATLQVMGKKVVQLCGFANALPPAGIKRVAQQFVEDAA